MWVGTISGNDPSAQYELELCTAADGSITGRGQWSSLLGGYNVRQVDGRWTEGRAAVVLRDVRLLEERPAGDFHFCTIDRYDLRLVDPTHLEGTYDSAACFDHATVRLVRQDAGTAPPAPPTPGQTQPSQPPQSQPAQPPTQPPAIPPPPAERGGTFGCSIAFAR